MQVTNVNVFTFATNRYIMIITDETICAISSAPGMGAIALIRLAGPKSIAITDEIFRSPQKDKKLADQKTATIHYGTLEHNGMIIDEVVVSIFRAPHSFTGEDIVEISCHGSVVIQQDILNALICHGARMAKPGEFTQRAFANGKMDLSQAEAVADLIASRSEAARRVALQQMRGGFRNELKTLRGGLMQFTSLLELELDFSEEDVEFADRRQLIELIDKIHIEVSNLCKSFSIGNAIKNGVPVAIVGPTNAGKSTLLNALLNEDRAIVSDIHGTTRDTIEDTTNIEGIIFRFIDTAGIRNTTDVIENIGIDRAFAKIEQAQIVILMFDINTDADTIATTKKQINKHLNPNNQRLLTLLNKSDLASGNISPKDGEILFSAQNANDIEDLKQRLLTIININNIDYNETVVTNARHFEALQNSKNALSRVKVGLESNQSGELVAMDIHEVLDELANITGEITGQDVLNNIFKNFCIGK